jgi:calcineurin-like phosphoesterase
MQILAIGDVIGKPGRQTVQKLLPGLRQQYDLDLVIANGENAAGGLGLTVSTAKEVLDAGVDIITSGNHIWDQKKSSPIWTAICNFKASELSAGRSRTGLSDTGPHSNSKSDRQDIHEQL